MDANYAHETPQLGHYEIGEVLTRTSRDVTCRAREISTGREVVLKHLANALCSDDDARKNFLREARLTAKLEHPQVVPVHEIGESSGGVPFFTMKMVRGVSVAEILSSILQSATGGGPVRTLDELLTVFQKVGDALAFAHGLGITHGAVSADQVIVGDYGEVLLMGWAAVSPESPGLDAYAGQQGDVRALGRLLYEMLTLRSAHDDEAVSRYGHRRPHLPGGRCPRSLAAVASKAISSDPGAGYTSVRALQAEVRAYQSGFATAAETASIWRQSWLLMRRHRGISVAMAASVILLGGMGATYAKGVLRAHRLANDERNLAVSAADESMREARRLKEVLDSLSHAAPAFYAKAGEKIKSASYRDAMENLEYAIEIDGKNADYQLARAHLLQASERLPEARTAYQQVLLLRDDAAARSNLELTEQLIGENENAIPLKPAVRKRLAEAVITQGRSAEAPPRLFRTD